VRQRRTKRTWAARRPGDSSCSKLAQKRNKAPRHRPNRCKAGPSDTAPFRTGQRLARLEQPSRWASRTLRTQLGSVFPPVHRSIDGTGADWPNYDRRGGVSGRSKLHTFDRALRSISPKREWFVSRHLFSLASALPVLPVASNSAVEYYLLRMNPRQFWMDLHLERGILSGGFSLNRPRGLT
jgi:hypothetical protein